MTDWHDLVVRQARETGARDLPLHAVEELAAHLEDIYRAARADGAAEAEARERALAALRESPLATLKGSRRRLRAPVAPSAPPALHRAPALGSLGLGHALGAAVRQFRSHPMFAFLAVLVLGLGTGASAVVYTIVDRVILRPLPYAEPDRLVWLWDTKVERGLVREPLSPVNFMDYRALPVFTDAAAWWRPEVNLTDPGMDPVRVRAIETGANLFEVLGVRPGIGPGFPKGGPLFSLDLIAVISDRLWRTRYHADPSLIGRPLTLNGAPFTVVGVMPPRFDFPGDIDVWQRSRWDYRQHSRAAHFMNAVARLAPGVDLERAGTETTVLAARLEHDFASTQRGWGLRLLPLLDQQLGYYRPALIVLFGAVALLMMISCLNVASLLLTRALTREREMAVRTVLGASPLHILVQLLAEGTVLSLAGSTAGVLGAALALPLIVAVAPADIPRLAEIAINWRVVAFALAIAAATTVVFGLVPALAIVRRQLTADLKTGDRAVSRGSRIVYRALVAGEDFLPLDAGWRLPFGIEGERASREGEAPLAQYHTVTDGFFESIGAHAVSGRLFTSRDTGVSPAVVVVNETLARRYLAGVPGNDHVLTTTATGIGPLGSNLVSGGRFAIVGVVSDVKDTPIGQSGEPAVYFVARQFPFRAMYLTVEAADAASAVAAIRSALRAVAPGIPLTDTRTWAERFRARTAEPRLLMTVLLFFGALAALLAALGVYGLFSWMVALRHRELAIRLTLGARPSTIGTLVLRQGALLAGSGLVAGWIVVRSSERALARVLFEVSPRDASSVAMAGGLLLAVSLLACLPPALRAMRVDPVEGLRAE